MSPPVVNSHLAYPRKTDEYTYRVPTPPRIVVPPPTLNSEAVPNISLKPRCAPNCDFLQSVNYDNLILENALVEWTYERRREAQAILPFLYLGPMTAAKDETWLQQHSITMLLGVRQKHGFQSRLMNSALRAAERLGLEHHTIDLANNQDLIHAFSTTTERINTHLTYVGHVTKGARVGRVLVFCESGNERAAGVVAAYLMDMFENVDFIKAMQLIQTQRFCVNFDDSMKRLLQGYWDILCARRDTASYTCTNGIQMAAGGGFGRAKRRFEEDDDERMDTDMDGGSEMYQNDMERFQGRSSAPFVD